MIRHLLDVLRARADKRAHSLPVTSGIGNGPDLLECDFNEAADWAAGNRALPGAPRHGMRTLFQELNAHTGPPRKWAPHLGTIDT